MTATISLAARQLIETAPAVSGVPVADPAAPPAFPDWAMPDYSQIIVEDDEPVESFFAADQMRLLTEVLDLWTDPDGRNFYAFANVGLFNQIHTPAIVPDVMVSFDIPPPADIDRPENRSYFIWIIGKAPDVVFEIVSDKRGGEEDKKMKAYAKLGVPYYAIFDPRDVYDGGLLRIYELRASRYVLRTDPVFEDLHLGLAIWEGIYNGLHRKYLRWTDAAGNVLPTGWERSAAEAIRSEEERKRADCEKLRADKLAARLRALGINPDEDVNSDSPIGHD